MKTSQDLLVTWLLAVQSENTTSSTTTPGFNKQGFGFTQSPGNVVPMRFAPGRFSFDLRDAKEKFELAFIDLALKETSGNKTQAAKLLGITREGLRKALMKRDPSTTTSTPSTTGEPGSGQEAA